MNLDSGQAIIFQPMGALVALTFIVLMLIPVRRFQAAFAKKVTSADFKYGESLNVPSQVSLPNRNYMNLLEIPLLFYVLCLSAFVAGRVTDIVIVLAWVYVVLRAMHSLVHLTFNNVMVRLFVFAASNIVLITLWMLFFFEKRPAG